MSETRAFRSFFVIDELLFAFTTYRTLTNSRSFRHACVRACVRETSPDLPEEEGGECRAGEEEKDEREGGGIAFQ